MLASGDRLMDLPLPDDELVVAVRRNDVFLHSQRQQQIAFGRQTDDYLARRARAHSVKTPLFSRGLRHTFFILQTDRHSSLHGCRSTRIETSNSVHAREEGGPCPHTQRGTTFEHAVLERFPSVPLRLGEKPKPPESPEATQQVGTSKSVSQKNRGRLPQKASSFRSRSDIAPVSAMIISPDGSSRCRGILPTA